MPCDHFIRVKIDNRDFKVEYDADGEPLHIKERKQKKPMVGIYEVSYFVIGTHNMGAPGTRPQRILMAVYKKRVKEDTAMARTP